MSICGSDVVVNTSFLRGGVDEVDTGRAQEYALLATLLSRSPDAQLLAGLSDLRDDGSRIGRAHAALAAAARQASKDSVAREYFELFSGLRDDALLPYASHYLTDTLYGRPLARLRDKLELYGIEKATEWSEPEDHAAFLCEIMAGLVSGDIQAPAGADRAFFDTHLASWIRRFFIDLENSKSVVFYVTVGTLGRTFIEIEAEAFALPT